MIPVSLDRAEESEVAEFLSMLDVEGLEWYIDSSRNSGESSDVFVLPTTILVDHEGRELGRLVGSADWQSPEASALIDDLLQEVE